MLDTYQDLVDQTYNKELALPEVLDLCQQSTLVQPALDFVDQLRHTAETKVWSAPRAAWAYAAVAYGLAQSAAPGSYLAATCALALGRAANALEYVPPALTHLEASRDYFVSYGPDELVAACDAEIGLSYAILSQLDRAQEALARVRERLIALSAPRLQATCDRVEGFIRLQQNRNEEAEALLRRSADLDLSQNVLGATAYTWCLLAMTFQFRQPQAALTWLEQARSLSLPYDPALHNARCDYYTALIYDELNRYPECLALLEKTRAYAQHARLHALTAACYLAAGTVSYKLDQFDPALRHYHLARDLYEVLEMHHKVDVCDLNIAVTYSALSRYDEALAAFHQLIDLAAREGRIMRVGLCYANIGLCYTRMARYDQALLAQFQARDAFLRADSPIYATLLQEDIATTYLRLGRRQEAVTHYREARQTYARHDQRVYQARCDTHLAELSTSLGQYTDALAHLASARATYVQHKMNAHVALADRLMARVFLGQGHPRLALERASQARAVVMAEGLLVDGALCDLIRGEAHLALQAVNEAVACLTAAYACLSPGFPDEAWRACYGLGRCAAVEGDDQQAMTHWLAALQMTNAMRASLPTERLGSSFFDERRPLYDDTLRLALRTGQSEQALMASEAAKSQTFAAWAGSTTWLHHTQSDSLLMRMRDREKALRREIEAARAALRPTEIRDQRPRMRGAAGATTTQVEILQHLTMLSQEYEELMERMRIARRDRRAMVTPSLFSSVDFRGVALGRLPARWASLAYHCLDDVIVVFSLDATRLISHIIPLTSSLRLALSQCTSLNPDFRELIYRNTLRGRAAPSHIGEQWMAQLGHALLPPEIFERDDLDMLVIAPHAGLHALPFHALRYAEQPLAARIPVVYTPSLSVLMRLLHDDPFEPRPFRASAPPSALVLGVAQFGSAARPLSYSEAEVEAVNSAVGANATRLWGPDATRAALLGLSETGELSRYDILHFATHAILDPMSPSLSRILLADDSLTVSDILTLRLQGQLVVLSTCESAMGERQPGDEMMSLAQAFFFAGARAVVASLWPVEDHHGAVNWMGAFYDALVAGATTAQAMQHAQLTLTQAAAVPYHWAPFILIGAP